METILEKLRAKFAGVSDKILEKHARKIAETAKTDEEITAAVDAVSFAQILEAYGDSRATDATKTAVLNYEKKYGIKDGVKVNQPTEQQQQQQQVIDTADAPEWAKALIENNRKLAEQVNKLTTDKITSGRKQQLEEKIKDLPESLRKGYERITLDTMEDEAFNTLLQEVDTEVKGIQSEITAKGAVFGKPASGVHQQPGGNGKEATEQEVKEVAARLGL